MLGRNYEIFNSSEIGRKNGSWPDCKDQEEHKILFLALVARVFSFVACFSSGVLALREASLFS